MDFADVDAHLAATGRDAKGRKQYRYTPPSWRFAVSQIAIADLTRDETGAGRSQENA